MEALRVKLSDVKLLFESLDEPAPSNPYKILCEYTNNIRHTLTWKNFLNNLNITCHPLAIIYTLLYLIYSYYYSITILSQLTFSIIIFKGVNESMREPRYAELKYSIYTISKLLSQLIGDFLTIPYHLLFEPSEVPFVYYQNTMFNDKIMSKLQPFIKYTQTFWQKNSLMQFLCICLDETPLLWFFQKSMFHIKRECITLDDQGLIALDWWVKPSTLNHSTDTNTETECKYDTNTSGDASHYEPCHYSDKLNHIEYKSKIYYQYHHKLYTKCFENPELYPMGNNTPILIIFPTFAGDSVSAPTRLICRYFVARNWRVIVYVKRGCGSFTMGEFLPLTNLKPFCLQGQEDYDVIIDLIQSRYPTAPKLLMGLSGGGAYIQTILGNPKYDGMFCGGIKIDAGMDFNVECFDLDERQPLIANILGQFFDVHVTKCRRNKEKEGILEKDKYYELIKWKEIDGFNEGLKGIRWSLEKFVSPCYEFGDDIEGYLKWAKPGDLENVNAPFLILDTFNDFMRNTEHICDDFSDRNENVIHVINRRGAHCIRREGLFGHKCWLSKIAFVFADYVVRQQTMHKK